MIWNSMKSSAQRTTDLINYNQMGEKNYVTSYLEYLLLGTFQ